MITNIHYEYNVPSALHPEKYSTIHTAKAKTNQLNHYSCSLLQQQKMINELIAKVSIVNCTF